MEVETSNVARWCVGLLLECVDYLSYHQQALLAAEGEGYDEDYVRSKHGASGDPVHVGKEKEKESEGGLFWKTLRSGLTSSSWSTRYRTS